MKIFFQILTTFALAYWPILVLTSVMLFDAPGSTNNLNAIVMALVVVFSPVILGLIYYFFNQSFWGLSPRNFLIATIVVPFLASLVFGYPKLLLNHSKGISSDGYFIKDGQLFYDGDLISKNAQGFEPMDEFKVYARTEDQVFFRGREVKNVDSKTFQKAFAQSTQYFKDAKNVIYEGKILPEADASTFTQMTYAGNEPTLFFKDKSSVYWLGKKIAGVDAATAKAVNTAFLADANNVFYFERKLPGADPGSFAILPDQESWGKDKKSIYFEDVALPQIDPATLEILNRGYFKDKNKVYLREGTKVSVVEQANPTTFKVTNWDSKTQSEATDGIHYFLDGKVK